MLAYVIRTLENFAMEMLVWNLFIAALVPIDAHFSAAKCYPAIAPAAPESELLNFYARRAHLSASVPRENIHIVPYEWS